MAKRPCLFICDQVDDCEMSGIPCNPDLIERGWCIATHRYVKLIPYHPDEDMECVQLNEHSHMWMPNK